MAGWFFGVSILISVFTVLSVRGQWILEDETCHTPDGALAMCTSIYSCKPMIDFLDSLRLRPITPSIRNFLMSYHCGSDGTKPKVCCPSKPIKYNLAPQNKTCRTPDQEVGTCISIHSCKPMLDVLDYFTFQPITPQVKKLLQSYRCNSDKHNPKVCCPTKPIDINQSSSSAIPEPPDVSKHRNIHLLPEECGLVYTGERIVHGDKTRLFEFPWMALLSYRTERGPEFKCGGTIINERYILTAAHCINSNRFPLLGVRIGEYDIRNKTDCEENADGELICAPPYQDLAIEEIIPHPEYDHITHQNDIGLLRMANPMNLTRENTKPICLPVDRARNYNFTDKNVIVTGWGATESSRFSPDLLKVKLPVVPFKECNKLYKNIASLNYKQLCAGGKTKSDSCAGDSGGPLQVAVHLYGDDRIVQHGIVSFGPKDCGQQSLPGVYTRVAFYMDWILDNIKP